MERIFVICIVVFHVCADDNSYDPLRATFSFTTTSGASSLATLRMVSFSCLASLPLLCLFTPSFMIAETFTLVQPPPFLTVVSAVHFHDASQCFARCSHATHDLLGSVVKELLGARRSSHYAPQEASIIAF